MILELEGSQITKGEERFDRALRPESFDNYIGQNELKKKLIISIEAAKQRKESVDHILLYGPPGLGKTTISNIIAKESDCGFRSIIATAIKSVSDLIEILTKLEERDVLFIDEIHGLSNKAEETLYSAMEDFKINIRQGNKEIINYDINPFCLVGATTAPGKMSAPLRDRFGINYTMQFYTPEDLAKILMANLVKLRVEVDNVNAILNIANRARGTPRIANRLLRRVRDFAQVRGDGIITSNAVNESMKLEGIDHIGISVSDKNYLDAIFRVYNCGPVGINAIASTIGEDKTTVEEFIEPFLVRKEFIARTKQGRILTTVGMKYVLQYIS